jgi:hypothetical protein
MKTNPSSVVSPCVFLDRCLCQTLLNCPLTHPFKFYAYLSAGGGGAGYEAMGGITNFSSLIDGTDRLPPDYWTHGAGKQILEQEAAEKHLGYNGGGMGPALSLAHGAALADQMMERAHPSQLQQQQQQQPRLGYQPQQSQQQQQQPNSRPSASSASAASDSLRAPPPRTDGLPSYAQFQAGAAVPVGKFQARLAAVRDAGSNYIQVITNIFNLSSFIFAAHGKTFPGRLSGDIVTVFPI